MSQPIRGRGSHLYCLIDTPLPPPPPKKKKPRLRRRWVPVSRQVSSNSVQRFQRPSRKYHSQSEVGAVIEILPFLDIRRYFLGCRVTIYSVFLEIKNLISLCQELVGILVTSRAWYQIDLYKKRLLLRCIHHLKLDLITIRINEQYGPWPYAHLGYWTLIGDPWLNKVV